MSRTITKVNPIISTKVFNESQSWHFVQIVKMGGHKLRVTIRRNAYDEQSFARAARWDGVQWHTVVSDPITACVCRTISYVDRAVLASAFAADAERLLAEAFEVVS